MPRMIQGDLCIQQDVNQVGLGREKWIFKTFGGAKKIAKPKGSVDSLVLEGGTRVFKK